MYNPTTIPVTTATGRAADVAIAETAVATVATVDNVAAAIPAAPAAAAALRRYTLAVDTTV